MLSPYNADLLKIERQNEVITHNVHTRLITDDILYFTGTPENISQLLASTVLHPLSNEIDELYQNIHKRQFIEVVLNSTCPLIGQSVSEEVVKKKYNAYLVGMRLDVSDLGKIGEVKNRGNKKSKLFMCRY